MSVTVKGGSSPRQVAAKRGRTLIIERTNRRIEFKKLQRTGPPPKTSKRS